MNEIRWEIILGLLRKLYQLMYDFFIRKQASPWEMDANAFTLDADY